VQTKPDRAFALRKNAGKPLRFAFGTDGVYADYTSCAENKQQKNGGRRKTEESNIFCAGAAKCRLAVESAV